MQLHHLLFIKTIARVKLGFLLFAGRETRVFFAVPTGELGKRKEQEAVEHIERV